MHSKSPHLPQFQPLRLKARGLAQHGWRKVTQQGVILYVMYGQCYLPCRTTLVVPVWGSSVTECTQKPSWATSRKEGMACSFYRHLPSLWLQQSAGATPPWSLWSLLIKPSPFPSFLGGSVTVDLIFITMPGLRKLFIFPHCQKRVLLLFHL